MAIKLVVYKRPDGREPYAEWLESIRDTKTQDRIETRVDRIVDGNFGDHRNVGGGVSELRLDFGPGYRVYCGRDGDTVVLLLLGGDKSTQTRDISRAKAYWNEHKEAKR